MQFVINIGLRILKICKIATHLMLEKKLLKFLAGIDSVLER